MAAKKKNALSRSEAGAVSRTSKAIRAGDVTPAPRDRQNGLIPAALTKAVGTRLLEELGFDPLVEAVRVARGENLHKDHPFLPVLLDWLAVLQRRIAGNAPPSAVEIHAFEARAAKALEGSFTPPELRTRCILELLQYVAPKMKAVDPGVAGGNGEGFGIDSRPLSKEEIIEVKDIFDLHF